MSRRAPLPAAALAALVVSVAVAAAAGMLRAPAPTPPSRASEAPQATPPRLRAVELPGRIVFVSERDHNREIYALTPATGAMQRLTEHAGEDYPAAAWQGGLLAVHASGEGAAEHREQLRSIRDERVTPLASASRRVRNPVPLPGLEGPDSRGIVFEASYHGFSDLYLLRQGGGAPERLTDAPEGSFQPAVDPTGRLVAFTSSRGGDVEIYRLDLDSRALLRLTWSPGEDDSPTFSPDGRRIVFVSARRGAPTVFVMAADGSRPRPLRPASDPDVEQRSAVLSPSGDLVAFVEQGHGRACLRVVRVDDGALVASTAGDWIDQTPAFSPDGRFVAFASDRSGDTELYALSVDGGEAVRLTRAPSADWLPLWLER